MASTPAEFLEASQVGIDKLLVQRSAGPVKPGQDDLHLAALKYLFFNPENGFGSRLLETEINKVLTTPKHPAQTKVDVARYQRSSIQKLILEHTEKMSYALEPALQKMGVTAEQLGALAHGERMIDKRALLEILDMPAANMRRWDQPYLTEQGILIESPPKASGKELSGLKIADSAERPQASPQIGKARLEELELTYDIVDALPDVNGYIQPDALRAVGLSTREIKELPGIAPVVDRGDVGNSASAALLAHYQSRIDAGLENGAGQAR